MKFKIGDLITRDMDNILAMVVQTNRQHHGIIRVQFYGGCPVTGEVWHSNWCDQLVKDWRHQ